MGMTLVPERSVRIETEGVVLDGDLSAPTPVKGVVVFAHGSGSSRHSPRNRRVAAALQGVGFATLLMDLLTAAEEDIDSRTRELRFDIPRLAARLTGAVDWLGSQQELEALPLALFGASTGAAAALITAANRPEKVRLVISRGGRPDLAGEALTRVRGPCLLIVGGNDRDVHRLNTGAAARMTAPAAISVVPGASHLFTEPGTLDAVIDLAVAALNQHL
jgi:pimeloyl-ACP methyl ester carboxylesterase